MVLPLGYVPTIPEPPSGDWNWVGALAFLGSLALAGVIYLLRAGTRKPGPGRQARASGPRSGHHWSRAA